MILLRDFPEGGRIDDPGTPAVPVTHVEWFDEVGSQVRLVFDDGSVRDGAGNQELVYLAGSPDLQNGAILTVTPGVPPLVWAPQRWDERSDRAWTAYVDGDEDAALAVSVGAESVEFDGDFNVWTFVESALVVKALILHGRGETELATQVKARLDVEARSEHPELSMKVLQRGFSEELPEDVDDRLRESGRRWARAESAGVDPDDFLQAHLDALMTLRHHRAGES